MIFKYVLFHDFHSILLSSLVCFSVTSCYVCKSVLPFSYSIPFLMGMYSLHDQFQPFQTLSTFECVYQS